MVPTAASGLRAARRGLPVWPHRPPQPYPLCPEFTQQLGAICSRFLGRAGQRRPMPVLQANI